MALSQEQLDQVGALLLHVAPGANPLPELRAAFPGLVFSRCDASDMSGETAVARAGSYDLFLVDNSEHCWRIVSDPHSAGGVVIAAHG